MTELAVLIAHIAPNAVATAPWQTTTALAMALAWIRIKYRELTE